MSTAESCQLTYGLSQFRCEEQLNIAIQQCPQQVVDDEISNGNETNGC